MSRSVKKIKLIWLLPVVLHPEINIAQSDTTNLPGEKGRKEEKKEEKNGEKSQVDCLTSVNHACVHACRYLQLSRCLQKKAYFQGIHT